MKVVKMKAMEINQLASLCIKFGLNSNGTKAELVNRLSGVKAKLEKV